MKTTIALTLLTILAGLALAGCDQSSTGNSSGMSSTNSSTMDTNAMNNVITNMPTTNSMPDMNTNMPNGTNQ